MRTLSKKLIIALMAISMATFPALNANAQGGAAGGIAGVSATTAVIAGLVIVGVAVAAENNSDSGRPDVIPDLTEPTTTTTTTVAGDSASSTTTTTTTN